MREDAVTDLVGEVEPPSDPPRLLVVVEAAAEAAFNASSSACSPVWPNGVCPMS